MMMNLNNVNAIEMKETLLKGIVSELASKFDVNFSSFDLEFAYTRAQIKAENAALRGYTNEGVGRVFVATAAQELADAAKKIQEREAWKARVEAEMAEFDARVERRHQEFRRNAEAQMEAFAAESDRRMEAFRASIPDYARKALGI